MGDRSDDPTERPRPRRRRRVAVMGWAGETLVALGALVLLYVVWQVWWTDVDANQVHTQSVEQLESEFGKGQGPRLPGQAPVRSGGKRASQVAGTVTYEPPKAGTVYAIVRIPRLGSDYAVPVVEGTSRADLERGLGHYEETVWPGQIGNFALAGHRMTHGGPLRDIERVLPGDRVIVETATTYYIYVMGRHAIVDPEHVEALAPVPEQPGRRPEVASITLTACHPKYASTQRWVVHGTLEARVPRAQWQAGTWHGSVGTQPVGRP